MPHHSSSQHPNSSSAQYSRHQWAPIYSSQSVTDTIDPELLNAAGSWPNHSAINSLSYDDPAIDHNGFEPHLFPAHSPGAESTGFGFLMEQDPSQLRHEWDQHMHGFVNTPMPMYEHMQYTRQPVSAEAYELCRRHLQRRPLLPSYYQHAQTQTSPPVNQAVPISPSYSSNSSQPASVYICDICGTETKREKDMRRHKAKQHGTTAFKCNVCGRKARRDDRLKAGCSGRHPHTPPQIEEIAIDE